MGSAADGGEGTMRPCLGRCGCVGGVGGGRCGLRRCGCVGGVGGVGGGR